MTLGKKLPFLILQYHNFLSQAISHKDQSKVSEKMDIWSKFHQAKTSLAVYQ